MVNIIIQVLAEPKYKPTINISVLRKEIIYYL